MRVTVFFQGSDRRTPLQRQSCCSLGGSYVPRLNCRFPPGDHNILPTSTSNSTNSRFSILRVSNLLKIIIGRNHFCFGCFDCISLPVARGFWSTTNTTSLLPQLGRNKGPWSIIFYRSCTHQFLPRLVF